MDLFDGVSLESRIMFILRF